MILLLLACSGSPKPPPAAKGTGDTGTPGLPDIEQTLVQPTMTAEEVATALSVALSTPPHPGEINTAYRFLMSQGDGTCPGSEENITDTWLYGCDAETGYSYAGVSSWFAEDIDEGLGPSTLQGVSGDFWIEDPDGRRLEGGGHSVEVAGATAWIGEIAGSWRWTGGEPWLVHGFSGNINIEYLVGLMISVNGAADISGTHISADSLTLAAGCDYGPSGTLMLRDPEGGWYSLEFNDCDPCTTVVFEGEAQGEACVDLSGFVTALDGRL